MRFVEQHPDGRDKKIRLTEDHRGELQDFLVHELEDAYAGRVTEEKNWEESLRQYHARPKQPFRDIPVQNAPNIEVPLVATACDALYAMVLDLLFSIKPTLTAASASYDNPENIELAKCAQDFGNWGERNEWRLRDGMETATLDCIQLGTGVLYIPYLDYHRQTDVGRIVDRGPRIFPVPLEDFLMPGGMTIDPQEMPWIAHRQWFTEGELNLRAKQLKWNIDGVSPITTVGWVRNRREHYGRAHTNLKLNAKLYEIHTVYAYFDVDGDGIDEDLKIVFDRTSRKLLKVTYNGYDCRPYEVGRYQLLAHLPYGIGAGEMLRPFQEEFTEMHNAKTLNILAANYRMWKAREGALDEPMLDAYANRVIKLPNVDDLVELQMTTAHTPAAALHEQGVMALAERRVGTGELSNPRPSNLLSSRTPGITALTAMQTVNRRFTAAFDQMRLMGARAIHQCFLRYRERILVEGRRGPAAENIIKVLGPERAMPLIAALKADDFREAVSVEFTASSALVNQMQERQDAVQLVNILSQYYSNVLQMMTIAAAPETPDPVREVAKKIASAGGEAIERTIRTFDKVRDPRTFIVDVNQEVDALAGPMQGDILTQLGAILGQGVGAAPGEPLLPPQ